MRRLWWAIRLILVVALCLPALPAGADGEDAEQRSGSGWVRFDSFLESPDHPLVREFLESWEDYQISQGPDMTPWSMEELRVGYWDLNDDGVEEMFVSFFDVATFFCWTGGCDILLFEKRDGGLHFLDLLYGFDVWISDSKQEIGVVESIDSPWKIREKREGYRFYWAGARTVCKSVEPELRAEIPADFIVNLSC